MENVFFGVKATMARLSVHWHFFCDDCAAHAFAFQIVLWLCSCFHATSPLEFYSQIRCIFSETHTNENWELFLRKRKIDFLFIRSNVQQNALKWKFTWFLFFNPFSECWPQVQVPLEERTTALHWTQWTTNWRLYHDHQGTVAEIRKGHWRWFDQGAEEYFSCHDLDGWKSLDFRHSVMEGQEPRRNDQWIQDQLPAIFGQQNS